MVNSGCCTSFVPTTCTSPSDSSILTVFRDPGSKSCLVSTSRHPCSGFHVPGVSPSTLAGPFPRPKSSEFSSAGPVGCLFSGRPLLPDTL